MKNIHTEKYNLGENYCRQLCEECGVPIFVHSSLCFPNIDIVQHCEEQDIEICALTL